MYRKSGKSEFTYDLLRYSKSKAPSKLLRATFDVFTPRPHLIVTSQPGVHVTADYSELPGRYKEELVCVVQQVVQETDLTDDNRPILSIHRGSWLTNTKHFHAHISMQYAWYERIYHQHERHLPRDWPDKKFVTRQWVADPSPGSYLKNVRGYPYKNYRREEAKACEEQPRQAKHKALTEFNGHKLFYHPSEAKIGMERLDSLLEMIEQLDKLASKLEMTQISKDNDKGGHLCVFLGPWGGEQFHAAPEEVGGYLLMTGPKFLQLCPEDMADDWLREFSKCVPPQDNT